MKKVIVALLMAVFVFALTACAVGKQGAPIADEQVNSGVIAEGGDSTESGDAPAESINITNLSDEKVEMTEKLQRVNYGDDEEQVNPFYKKGMSEENTACYVVHLAGQEAETNIPMDNTVIYSTDEGESYIEKVGFSYEIDGDTMNVEQYRLYINTAQE